MKRPTRVVLLSRQALVQSGLRALLERTEEMEVREASNKEQLLTLMKEFKPQAILIDVMERELYDVELLRQVDQKFPLTRALALTDQEDEGQVLQALNMGAAGLISRSASSAELVRAIKAVGRGENYISEVLEHAVLKHSKATARSVPKLTSRQNQVLKMLAEGHGTKEIAVRLHISPKTVETHRARVMRRLNIHDIAGLVRYAVNQGLIKLEE